jgi:hypothetical protein
LSPAIKVTEILSVGFPGLDLPVEQNSEALYAAGKPARRIPVRNRGGAPGAMSRLPGTKLA